LYFRNPEFLFPVRICRAQMHHCQNQSFRCGDIAFFLIFKIDAAAILDCWNREILSVIVVQSVETHQHAKFRQNRSIGCEGIKIFYIFQNGGRRHLGFSKSWIFIDWRYLEGSDASLYQILSKSVASLRRYSNFSNFQDGGHLEFWKSQNFIGDWGQEGPDVSALSACRMLSKSVNRLRRYKIFRFF